LTSNGLPGATPQYAICAVLTLDKRLSIFIRDKPILSSERMLHKDYDRKGSAANIRVSLVVILKGLAAKTK
jgi:hypothetical protein